MGRDEVYHTVVLKFMIVAEVSNIFCTLILIVITVFSGGICFRGKTQVFLKDFHASEITDLSLGQFGN